MTVSQHIITILMFVIGTMLTRFLPFLLFPSGKRIPPYILYLGKALPGAVFGLLVVYCLKGASVAVFPYALPEFVSMCAVVILHLWKRQMLLSIAGGTVLYMLLVQLVFV